MSWDQDAIKWSGQNQTGQTGSATPPVCTMWDLRRHTRCGEIPSKTPVDKISNKLGKELIETQDLCMDGIYKEWITIHLSPVRV